MQIFDIKSPIHQSYYHDHFVVIDLEYNTVRVQQFSQKDCINIPIIANTIYETVANIIEYEQLWSFLKSPWISQLFNNIFNNIKLDDQVADLTDEIQRRMSKFGRLAVDIGDVYVEYKHFYSCRLLWSSYEIGADILKGNEMLMGSAYDIEVEEFWSNEDDYDD